MTRPAELWLTVGWSQDPDDFQGLARMLADQG